MTNIFLATVTLSNPGSYLVAASSGEQNHILVTMVAPMITMGLGFKSCVLPNVGQKILCIKADSTVYGFFVPGNDPNSGKYFRSFSKTSVNATNKYGAALNNNPEDSLTQNMQRPNDYMPGEFSMVNDYGISLNMMQLFASLKATDLAQVQFHLIDNLVKLISYNFEHHTSMGTTSVTNTGNALDLESTFTHILNEALGKPCIDSLNKEPAFEKTNKVSVDDKDDYYELKDGNAAAVERLKVFIGALGDFIHLYITKPSEHKQGNINKLYSEATPEGSQEKPDVGLADIHFATDGGLHVRSVKEIFIEKTNVIRVPQRINSSRQIEGSTEVQSTNKPEFTFDDQVKFNSEDPSMYFLQLRDYLAHNFEEVSVINFLSRKKEIVMGDISESKPEYGKTIYVDPYTKSKYVRRTAGIYFMENGGVVIRDGFNSAIVMENGNIMLQPSLDLIVQPLRNFIGKIGAFFNLHAKEDLDMASTKGAMRIKSDKMQYFYSKNSGILFHTDGVGITDIAKKDRETNNVIDGIVFKSKTGIYFNATVELVFKMFKNAKVFFDVPNFYLKAKNLLTYTTADTTFVSDNSANVISKNSLSCLSKGDASFVGENTAIAKNKKTYFSNATEVIDGHNHGFEVKGTGDNSGVDAVVSSSQAAIDGSNTGSFKAESSFDKIVFSYLKEQDYKFIPQSDLIPQTLAQQALLKTSEIELESWDFAEDKVDGEGQFPYPGHEQWYVSSNLQNVDVDNKQIFNKNITSPSLDNEGAPANKKGKLEIGKPDYKVLKLK